MIRRRMPILLPPFEDRLRKAVAHYWRTLEGQSHKQKAGVDHGRRGAVTGGKQMDGFCELVDWLLRQNGLGEASIYVRTKRELPGFFRPTKDWDMLVVHEGHLIAAVEFKSQRGPSFGNNFNNRTEEAIGNAADLRTAYREGAYGTAQLRPPWLGWVMLLEDCQKSARPVAVTEPHFSVFPEFRGASYCRRYELLLRKLVQERLYDAAAFLASTEQDGPRGYFTEPAQDLTMKGFLAQLAGHVAGYLAAIK
jgi:hypothetical protein